MNKITRKLFFYFTMVASFFAIIVFIGFYGTFRYYSYEHHERELQKRAQTIQVRLEQFMNNCPGIQEMGSYIKVLDDISLADAYFISHEVDSFTCTCSCQTTLSIDKIAPEEIYEYGLEVIDSGEYAQTKRKDKSGQTFIYIGIPVKEEGVTRASVVIKDSFDMDQDSFFLSIVVLFFCLLGALVLSGLLSVILARRFLRPIHKIAGTTKELANGNYEVRTDLNDRDEIGVLARETDILADKLKEARNESERMEQMKRDYLSQISHELQTPVTVIRSSLEAICDGVIEPEEVLDYQKQMLLESISLQRLINDMLELTRLENNDFPIEKTKIDLLQVFDDAMRAVRMLAVEKEIQIHYEKTEMEWTFEGDYGRLRQMFITVLDNAIKYSDTKKNIWIRSQTKKDSYIIVVQDEGCGIPKEEQKEIFQKFHRSSNAGCSGTGLGLAIMQNIARRHDISVHLHSEQGIGTAVSFRIPKM